MNLRSSFFFITVAALFGASATAQTTIEDFETYSVANGVGSNLQISFLDESAIANGQGPGLVQDGCVYAALFGQLTWFGANFNGNTISKAIAANSSDSKIELRYDVPVQHFVLNLVNHHGGVDDIDVVVLDGQLAQIRHDYYLVTAPTPVRINYSAASIGRVLIRSNTFGGGSPCVDDHKFSVTGGLQIALNGSCPGPMTVNFSGFSPNKTFALLQASQPASFTIPVGNACTGEVIGLMNPTLLGTFKANSVGSFVVNKTVPAAFCGRYLQAVDLSNCMQSNVIRIQ